MILTMFIIFGLTSWTPSVSPATLPKNIPLPDYFYSCQGEDTKTKNKISVTYSSKSRIGMLTSSDYEYNSFSTDSPSKGWLDFPNPLKDTVVHVLLLPLPGNTDTVYSSYLMIAPTWYILTGEPIGYQIIQTTCSMHRGI